MAFSRPTKSIPSNGNSSSTARTRFGPSACVRKVAGKRPQAMTRVNRGGGWNNIGGNCRPANRSRNTPERRNNNLGFRVARARSTVADAARPTRPLSCPAGATHLHGQNRTPRCPVLVVAVYERSGQCLSSDTETAHFRGIRFWSRKPPRVKRICPASRRTGKKPPRASRRNWPRRRDGAWPHGARFLIFHLILIRIGGQGNVGEARREIR